MRLRTLAPLLCVFLLPAVSVESATTSRLEGRVVDDQGEPLTNVEVTISSPSLIGGPQSTESDANGSFSFSFLLVGEYTVEAVLEGFTPATAVAPVRLDRTASVTLLMARITFSSEIQVVAEVPIIDPTRTNMGEVFSEEFLQLSSIGSGNRFYVRAMDQVAGVVPSGHPRVFGATGSENAYLIDGVNSTDPSVGFWGTYLLFDAIEEISVLTGGLDAEFGFGTGGVMNLVTKSGGNQFSGTVDVRYRDQRFDESGEHFDSDLNQSSKRVLSATFGGPIVRDRLWFFAAFEDLASEYTPAGAPATTTSQRNNYLGKLTWAINTSNRLTAMYSDRPDTREYSGVDWFTTADATGFEEWTGQLAKLEFNSTLSDSLLLTAAIGFNRTDLSFVPMVNGLDTPPEFDLDANLLFSNPQFVEIGERDRDDHRLKLSYFLDNVLGYHQFDAGLEYQRLQEETAYFRTGGYQLYYFNNAYWDGYWPDGDGDGLIDLGLYRDAPAETARDPISGDAEGWSVFVQDQWRLTPDLSLRLGLRYDTLAHTNHVGETVADFGKWLPRLGLAWDVSGRGRHILRAGWSQYMHPGVTNLAMFVPGVTIGTEEYWGLDYLCGTYGICDRETAELYFGPEFIHVDDDGDEHLFYLANYLSELPAETVDTLGVGSLRAPYRDELILSYEARVAEETSLELSYVNKKYHDMIEDTCINNTWAWGDGESPSLDDPSTWTDEGGCSGSVRANLDGLSRNYEAVILRVASRARSWFHLLGSYTFSRQSGNNVLSQPYTGFGTGFVTFPGSDFDFFPTNFVNLEIEDFDQHRVKLNGFLMFPLDFTLGVGAYYRSPQSLSVYAGCFDMHNPSGSGLAELDRLGIDYNEMLQYCQSPSSGSLVLEPQDSRRGVDLWEIDLQISKGFRIGSTRLVGIVSVLNVTSEEAATGFVQNPFNRLGWGTPTSWQSPRGWELGLRLEF